MKTRVRVSEESQKRISELLTYIDSVKASKPEDLDSHLQKIVEVLRAIFKAAGIAVSISDTEIKNRLLTNEISSTQEFVKQISAEKYDDKLRGKLRAQGVDATIVAGVNEAFALGGQRSEVSRNPKDVMRDAVTQLRSLVGVIKSKDPVFDADLDELSNKIYDVLTKISNNSNRMGMESVTYKSPAQIKQILLTQKFENVPNFLQSIVSMSDEQYQIHRPHITNAVTIDAEFKKDLLQDIGQVFSPFGIYPEQKLKREDWQVVVEELRTLIAETKKSSDPQMLDQNLGKISEILFQVFSAAGSHLASASQIKAKLLVTKVNMVTELVRQINGSDNDVIRQDIVYKGINADLAKAIGEVFGLAGQHKYFPNPNDIIRIAISGLEKELGKFNAAEESALEKLAGSVYRTLETILEYSQNSEVSVCKLKSFDEVKKVLFDKKLPQMFDFVSAVLVEGDGVRFGGVSSAFSKYGLTLDLVQKISSVFEPFGNRRDDDLKPDDLIRKVRLQLQDSLVESEKAALRRESDPEAFHSSLEKTASDFSVFIKTLVEHKSGVLNGIDMIKLKSKEEVIDMFLNTQINSGYDLFRALINDPDAKKPTLKPLGTSLDRFDINANFTTRIAQVFNFADHSRLESAATTSSSSTYQHQERMEEDRESLGSFEGLDVSHLRGDIDFDRIFKDDLSDLEESHERVQPSSAPAAKRSSITQLHQSDSKMTKLGF